MLIIVMCTVEGTHERTRATAKHSPRVAKPKAAGKETVLTLAVSQPSQGTAGIGDPEKRLVMLPRCCLANMAQTYFRVYCSKRIYRCE